MLGCCSMGICENNQFRPDWTHLTWYTIWVVSDTVENTFVSYNFINLASHKQLNALTNQRVFTDIGLAMSKYNLITTSGFWRHRGCMILCEMELDRKYENLIHRMTSTLTDVKHINLYHTDDKFLASLLPRQPISLIMLIIVLSLSFWIKWVPATLV